MLTLGVALAVHGFTTGNLGEGDNGPSTSSASLTTAVVGGGPVVNSSDLASPGLSPASRTIALTFDDGPSEYTTGVLDVLRRFHARATFFVVGKQVAEHTDIVRRMVADGNEVGVHSFTHPELGSVSAWREGLELDQTQQAIAGATGYTTNLLRLPYSSKVANLTPTELLALRRAGNYWAVFTDLDTKDWTRPGVPAIVAASVPQTGAGAIVMMHDGGGDRSQTVEALTVLIPKLQSRGYRFVTVSESVGLASPFRSAGVPSRLRGSVVIAAVRFGDLVAWLLSATMILVAALSVLRLLCLVLLARRHAHSRIDETADHLPTISVIVPAFNEEVGIAAAVKSVAASDYPRFEIVVVDDGSTDGTVAAVKSAEVPGLRLIRQENGGKPVALNTGIASSSGDVLVLMDGDTVFEPDTLRRLVQQLATPTVGAVSGNTKVGNRHGLLGRWQHIEYVIGFNLDRRMFDVLQCMPTIPGAIGAFRREVLEQVGGLSSDTLAEDTDLTMAICRAGWRVVYEPQAVAWTEAPAGLGQLWRQRYRWCFGTMQAMWKHRRAVFERGAAGKLGRRGLPYLLLFQVLLPLLAPFVDVAAIYSILFQNSGAIALTWASFLLLQFLAALYAFRLDRESPRVLWAIVTQQFVYRQLMYLVVIQSLTTATAGIRFGWHKLRRTGNLDAAPAPSTP
ncbi:bifunctional polysaccharide deacetylase/glycosyltransferase family 2 protein [Nakamurella panacisegetis]|nr:bifunctional polysaccharide deacetylase/glycosyltransferase family 2 protein [Nakamurella panacisegetis]